MTAAGLLYLQYANPTMGERHTLRLHICPFNPAPASTAYGANDHLYTGAGPVVPTETSVLQTFAALAALWQPYYSNEWLLSVDSIWQQVGDDLVVLDPGPTVASLLGADTSDPSGDPRLGRRFRLLSTGGRTRHLFLAQVAGTALREGSFEVGPSSGGLDARDRALMNYVSGGTGGAVVMPDGLRCFPITDMRVWWARRLEPAPAGTGGGGGGGGTGTGIVGDCLVYPRGAALCNDPVEVVTLSTPTAVFQFDEFGITLPGGHRLEVI